MSIERSGTAASPKTVTGVESTKGKGKVNSGDEADTPEASGFSAILTSLEPQTDQSGAADTQVRTEEKSQIAALPVSDPLLPLAPNLPTDLAMLLAQAGTVAGAKLNTVSDERLVAPNLPTDPAMLPAQAGTVAGAKLSTISDERPAGVKGGNRLIAVAVGADKSEASIAASAALGSDKSADTKQNVNALLDQMAQGASAQTRKARGAESQADVAARLTESRALTQSSLADAVAREPALSGALLTSGIGDSFLRQADRAAAKSSLVSVGSGIEGIWGQQALQAGNRVDAPSVIADASTLSLESMVADTVSYWVTQGVQNAELKLDGFGGQPVEVSISLKGDEAHIGFRTDQPEIRQILEGAVAHLKDLLTSEGLVLSGVSVGTSGQDSKGAQEQRNRPGVRQATIATTQAVPTESLQRVNQPAGRAVDLFV